MRFLVDTNLFIEVLLNQVSAGEARTFLENRKGHELFVSDFALHSIRLLLFRQKQHQVFRQFLQDMMGRVGIGMVSLTAQEMDSLVDLAAKFNLDFDDAYQYSVAIRHGLKIVSFDADLTAPRKAGFFPPMLCELSWLQQRISTRSLLWRDGAVHLMGTRGYFRRLPARSGQPCAPRTTPRF